ncbi:iron-sulfur cluster repair di-iron protein [Muricauda sp. CAU 1633]|uniref:iron-sulfur cluster repair di-iron protein n=1 Tax=Allomuricauda sp. CAU 1633 TaxID=2816036 RepID=UPI001A8EA726|nr:iron-sulfur cluster repair di-iron protein [Muricauda sp. CAU 1633]MBO0323779.1 iron-sulfur cluster repair di-iron protein [Muricauda sp. CAU 1633]
MKITKNSNVGDIVTQNYKASDLFKAKGVDFCCGGNNSVDEACRLVDLTDSDIDELVVQLNAMIDQPQTSSMDVTSWPLDLLVDYIEKKHHAYIEENIPIINGYLEKIVNVHGDKHMELYEVQTIFKEAMGELSMHLKKEELMLFPYIKKMVRAKNSGVTLELPSFGSIVNPISKMDDEHDFEGEAFRKIALLTQNYATPEDGCNTYRITMEKLREFEEDLHFHIHLENNILFRKAIALEKELI